MNNFGRNLALWVIIGFLLIMLFNMFQSPSGRDPQDNLAFSDFIGEVKRGNVRNVTIQGQQITGNYDDGRSFKTYAPDDPTLVPTLTEHNVRISAGPDEEDGTSLSAQSRWNARSSRISRPSVPREVTRRRRKAR